MSIRSQRMTHPGPHRTTVSRALPAAALVAAALVLAALTGCALLGFGPPLDATAWRLTGWSVDSLYPKDFNITAEFSEGRISGVAAVNTYGGPYVAEPAPSFRVGALTMTEMAAGPDAMRAQEAYLDLLKRARTYKAAPDSLRLYDEKGNELLIFSAVSK